MNSTVLKFFTAVTALGVAMACVMISPTAQSGKKDPEMGTRQAVNYLLRGEIPPSWSARIAKKPPAFLNWPMPGRRLGRGFGSNNGKHLAIDSGAPIGTPVQAMAPGIVAYAGDGIKGYGNTVLILHGGGWVTLYAHLSEITAKPKQWVKRKAVVAKSGNTGISKGPHLHFALFVDGAAKDPLPLMNDYQPHRLAGTFLQF